jgi:hypothetical protein
MLDIGIEMRKKPIVLALILVIVSAVVGTGFSLAAGTIQTDNRVAYLEDVEFTDDFTVSDNEEIDKDVADAVAIRDPLGSFFGLTITNAYPGYEVYLDFTVKNVGNAPVGQRFPVLLYDIPNPNYDTDAFSFEISGVYEGLWLLYVGDTANGRLTVKVLQGAEEDTSYLHDWNDGVNPYNYIIFSFTGGGS